MNNKAIDFLKEGLLDEALKELSSPVTQASGDDSDMDAFIKRVDDLRRRFNESVVTEDVELKLVQQSRISIEILEMCRFYGEFNDDEMLSIVESQNVIIARQRILIGKLSSRLEEVGYEAFPVTSPRVIRPHIKATLKEVNISRINKSEDSDGVYYVGCTIKEDPDKLIAFAFPKNEATAVAVAISGKTIYTNGYDLFFNFLSDMNYEVTKVVVDAYRGKKYYCKYVVNQSGVIIEFGCNHVEGITIAALMEVPLLVSAEVLSTNAFSMRKFSEE